MGSNTSDSWFVATFNVTNSGNTLAGVSAYIGSDFVVDDYRLRLLDSDMETLVESIPLDVPYSHQTINWRSGLSSSLSPGTYFLQVRQYLGRHTLDAL